MNEEDNRSQGAEAQEIVQRMSPATRTLFQSFELRNATRYRERWQALRAFERIGMWNAYVVKAAESSGGRIASSPFGLGPFVGNWDAYVVKATGSSEGWASSQLGPYGVAYYEIQEIRKAMAIERVMARQAPVEGVPEAPFHEPQEADDDPSPPSDPTQATRTVVAPSEPPQDGKPPAPVQAGSKLPPATKDDYTAAVRWSALRVTEEFDTDGYTARDQLRVDARDWCREHGVMYGKHSDWYGTLKAELPGLLRPDGQRRIRRRG
jgi:hypothetical protein